VVAAAAAVGAWSAAALSRVLAEEGRSITPPPALPSHVPGGR